MAWLPLFMAAPQGQGAEGGGGLASMLFFMLTIFAIFYFLVIMPQRRAQKARDAMLSALKKGDEVVTSGGIFGTVVGLKEDSVVLKVDDSTRLRVQRGAVTTVVKADE